MTIDELIAIPWLIALLIFLARVADVSLGTFRTIVVFRGHKMLAAFIGFFEIIIWLVAAAQVLKNLNEWYLAIAYAGGFATGNFVGMWLEGRFAIGEELIRCISCNRKVISDALRAKGFKVISIDGDMGNENPIEVMFIIEKRKKVPEVIKSIKQLDPEAIYSVSDVKNVYDGVNPVKPRSFLDSSWILPNKRR